MSVLTETETEISSVQNKVLPLWQGIKLNAMLFTICNAKLYFIYIFKLNGWVKFLNSFLFKSHIPSKYGYHWITELNTTNEYMKTTLISVTAAVVLIDTDRLTKDEIPKHISAPLFYSLNYTKSAMILVIFKLEWRIKVTHPDYFSANRLDSFYSHDWS